MSLLINIKLAMRGEVLRKTFFCRGRERDLVEVAVGLADQARGDNGKVTDFSLNLWNLSGVSVNLYQMFVN